MLPKGLPIYNSFNGHVISILHIDRNYYVVYRQEYKKTKLAIVRWENDSSFTESNHNNGFPQELYEYFSTSIHWNQQ